MPGTKKARAVEFEGTEHTEASLNEMTTGTVCQLVMRMRGETKPPKPATKAKAIDLVWRAAESLPKAPQIKLKKPEAPHSRAETLDATTATQGTKKQAPGRRPKVYSIAEGGVEAPMLPQARQLAQAMKDAGRPLTMVECSALLKTKKASANPHKIVSWYFAKVFRPLGLLVEARGSSK